MFVNCIARSLNVYIAIYSALKISQRKGTEFCIVYYGHRQNSKNKI